MEDSRKCGSSRNSRKGVVERMATYHLTMASQAKFSQYKEEENMKVTFEMEKATKNTIRFNEVLESELAAPKIGTLYIPKSTLAELKWKEGSKVSVELSISK